MPKRRSRQKSRHKKAKIRANKACLSDKKLARRSVRSRSEQSNRSVRPSVRILNLSSWCRNPNFWSLILRLLNQRSNQHHLSPSKKSPSEAPKSLAMPSSQQRKRCLRGRGVGVRRSKKDVTSKNLKRASKNRSWTPRSRISNQVQSSQKSKPLTKKSKQSRGSRLAARKNRSVKQKRGGNRRRSRRRDLFTMSMALTSMAMMPMATQGSRSRSTIASRSASTGSRKPNKRPMKESRRGCTTSTWRGRNLSRRLVKKRSAKLEKRKKRHKKNARNSMNKH